MELKKTIQMFRINPLNVQRITELFMSLVFMLFCNVY